MSQAGKRTGQEWENRILTLGSAPHCDVDKSAIFLVTVLSFPQIEDDGFGLDDHQRSTVLTDPQY